jgi:hypothetical protein
LAPPSSDIGSFLAYSLLHKHCPKAIFQQHGPFQPAPDAFASHCCFLTDDAQEEAHVGLAVDASVAQDEAAVTSPSSPQILTVPGKYRDMQDALRAASVLNASVVRVMGGSDVSWDETVHTAGGHEQAPHPDLDMQDLEDDAPPRRFSTDLLPDLQPHINHALKHPQMIPLEVADELEVAHAARYSESHLITDRDIILGGMASMRRPDPEEDAELLVPYPNVLSMPRLRVRIDVEGPPNARTWGRWRLDKNCFGSFTGLTCAMVRAHERTHVECETFTVICLGGPWEMSHVDFRAGGPAGAMVMLEDSEVDMRWCAVGGMDDGEYRCVEGLVVKDATLCNVTACVLEFCGGGPVACGTAVSVQNCAVLRVNASLFQHNYNHIQILNHPIVRSGNCTFWNHSYALWLAYETAEAGSQLALEDARIYGAVWRNDWRPAALVERNNQRFSRHLAPDTTPPAGSTGERPPARADAGDARVSR